MKNGYHEVTLIDGKWCVVDKDGDVRAVYIDKKDAEEKVKYLNEYADAMGDWYYEQWKDDFFYRDKYGEEK